MYKKILITAPISIIVTNNKGTITFLNDYAKAFLNEDSFPVIGINICDLLFKTISDFNQNPTLNELLKPTKETLEYWFKTKSGNTFYAELKHSSFTTSQKKIHLWLVTKLEKKHLAYELKERVKEQLSILNVSEILFKSKDLYVALKDCLPLIQNGWQFPEAVSVRIKLKEGDVFATDNFKETPWLLHSSIESSFQKYGSLEVFYLFKVPEYEGSIFLHEEEKLIGILAKIIGLFMEQWYAIKKIKANEILIKKTTSQVPANTYQFEINKNGKLKIHFHNKGTEEFNHIYSPENVIEQPKKLIDIIFAEDVDKFNTVMKEAFKSQSFISIQYRIHVNDTLRWRWLRALPYEEENGKTIWYGASQDITELFEYISVVEQILFDISHVIRRPVASILGLTNLMNEKDISEEELISLSKKMNIVANELDKFIHKLNVEYNKKNRKGEALKLDIKSLIDKRENIFNKQSQ
jgi:hypothetical protein